MPLIPANDVQRVAALHALGILDTPQDDGFDNLTQLAASIFNAPIALVSMVDLERQWFKSAHGLCATETRRDVSFCSHVVYNECLLVVEDATQDPRFATNPLVVGEPHIRFYAGAPLRSDSGLVLGTLCVLDTQPRAFTAGQIDSLKKLATQVEQLISLHQRTNTLAQEVHKTSVINARYEAITQGAAAGIVRINGKGVVIEVNQYVCDMLGYQASDLLGKNVSMLMPMRWGASHDGYLAAYQQSGQARVIGTGREVEALSRDGRNIPVHLAVSEVQQGADPDDHDNRQFIGILSDLSDIHAAREREKHERALLEVLHKGLTDYHALLSGNTLWTFLKEALRRLTGSEYALIGEVVPNKGRPALKIHAITDLSWNDESRQLMAQLTRGDMMLTNPDSMLGRVFANGETIVSNEMRTDPRAGGLPPGHPELRRYLGVPITDRGQVIGMYAIANSSRSYDQSLVDWLKPFTSTCALLINLYRQLNEQQRFTQELRDAKEMAEKASQAKTDFLSSMSHELRTPLNSILGFAQLLQNSRQRLPDRQLGQVDQIMRSGRHLLSLINEVLDLARIESGHMSLSLEPINAHDVLRDAIEIITPLAAQQGIALDVPAPQRGSTHIQGDYTRVKQVLINLLNNAIKYNRDGGSVSLVCEARGERYRISIRDTGVGIPADRINELFQPFNRLGAESGSVEGTGVGLALTRKLVTLMNGEIGVKSQQGKGSEFWFELPLSTGGSGAQTGPEPLAGPVQTLAPGHRVLYIEDNPANQRLMRELFDDIEHTELQCVHNAELGIELACSDPPDLILMDIDLPGMNGFDAQKILRNNPLTADIPVLAISAAASTHHVKRAKEAGFIDYLTKPFDLLVFMAQVKEILEQGKPQ